MAAGCEYALRLLWSCCRVVTQRKNPCICTIVCPNQKLIKEFTLRILCA
ncbi:hypothetical protein OTSANNIE_0440 [Anaplasma phagocytophilum str. Annie]|nr:hypothetical protein OTSANNIE_0440 [Anaplasma phagocytophilum str. Annie]